MRREERKLTRKCLEEMRERVAKGKKSRAGKRKGEPSSRAGAEIRRGNKSRGSGRRGIPAGIEQKELKEQRKEKEGRIDG